MLACDSQCDDCCKWASVGAHTVRVLEKMFRPIGKHAMDVKEKVPGFQSHSLKYIHTAHYYNL